MSTSQVKYLGNLRTEMQHTRSGSMVRTDAPVDNNGKGELFSPTDLVASALASCAITIMGIAAETHEIPFNHVSVEVEKIMESNPRRIGAINLLFTIGDGLNDKQKRMLEAAARNCPVAKSLSLEVQQKMEFVYTAV